MPKYIGLVIFTEQTINDLNQSPDRLDMARETVRKMVSWDAYHVILPSYDIVIVVEAHNDQAVIESLSGFGTVGEISTVQALPFSESAYKNKESSVWNYCPKCGSTIKHDAPRHPPKVVMYSGEEIHNTGAGGWLVESLVHDEILCTNSSCDYRFVSDETWVWVWHLD